MAPTNAAVIGSGRTRVRMAELFDQQPYFEEVFGLSQGAPTI